MLDAPPPNVQLTYDEAVEPRFAIISVTNADGHAGDDRRRSAARRPNPDTLVVPLRPHLPEGWYLIYWRAISVDGHPVQGAFTYAVGPNPGPAPQFPVPSISATAVTPQLLIARWVMFLSVMVAIGLFVLRLLIARPLVRRVPGSEPAAAVGRVRRSLGVGLIAIPVYLDFATANDSLRSVFDLGALVPLFRVTAFGRGYVDMSCASRCSASPRGSRCGSIGPTASSARSPSSLAGAGALLAAAAVLRHPRRGRPRRADLAARAVAARSTGCTCRRARSGSAGWSGCSCCGATPARGATACRCLAVVVPRFSNVALVVGARAARHRDRRDDHPHAGRQRAVGDRLRRRDPRQDRAADRRDGARVGQPAAHHAPTRSPPASGPTLGDAAARLLRR